jgi:hypothetical protein
MTPPAPQPQGQPKPLQAPQAPKIGSVLPKADDNMIARPMPSFLGGGRPSTAG